MPELHYIITLLPMGLPNLLNMEMLCRGLQLYLQLANWQNWLIFTVVNALQHLYTFLDIPNQITIFMIQGSSNWWTIAGMDEPPPIYPIIEGAAIAGADFVCHERIAIVSQPCMR